MRFRPCCRALGAPMIKRMFALSHMIVDRAENFFVSPSHVEGWSAGKRKVIEEAFVGTVIRGEPATPSPDLMLF